MLRGIEQVLDCVDLGLLLFDFGTCGSIGREFHSDIEFLRAPTALPRGVQLGVSCPRAIQSLEDDWRRGTEIAERLEREVRSDVPPCLECRVSAVEPLR